MPTYILYITHYTTYVVGANLYTIYYTLYNLSSTCQPIYNTLHTIQPTCQAAPIPLKCAPSAGGQPFNWCFHSVL